MQYYEFDCKWPLPQRMSLREKYIPKCKTFQTTAIKYQSRISWGLQSRGSSKVLLKHAKPYHYALRAANPWQA
jgi:hypothetical protein